MLGYFGSYYSAGRVFGIPS